METHQIKERDHHIVLVNNEEELHLGDRWFQFCKQKDSDIEDHFYAYSHNTHTYYEDYLLYLHDVEQSLPRAIELQQEFMLWKLTS